jgi:hypothetical protein
MLKFGVNSLNREESIDFLNFLGDDVENDASSKISTNYYHKRLEKLLTKMHKYGVHLKTGNNATEVENNIFAVEAELKKKENERRRIAEDRLKSRMNPIVIDDDDELMNISNLFPEVETPVNEDVIEPVGFIERKPDYSVNFGKFEPSTEKELEEAFMAADELPLEERMNRQKRIKRCKETRGKNQFEN